MPLGMEEVWGGGGELGVGEVVIAEVLHGHAKASAIGKKFQGATVCKNTELYGPLLRRQGHFIPANGHLIRIRVQQDFCAE